MTKDVQNLLALAHEHDNAAREARRAAGLALAAMRAGKTNTEWAETLRAMDLDIGSAQRLMEMGATGTVHTWL